MRGVHQDPHTRLLAYGYVRLVDYPRPLFLCDMANLSLLRLRCRKNNKDTVYQACTSTYCDALHFLA